MRAEKVLSPATLDPESLKVLCGSEGPCVSIYLPPYRAAELDRPASIRMHNAISLAARRLAEMAVIPGDTGLLLGGLRSLAQEPAFVRGHAEGLAIFHSPQVSEYLETSGLTEDMVVIGDRFHILPLVTILAQPRVFHILLLEQRQVGLLCCTGNHCKDVPLPHGMPKSLDEAMAFKPPDHMLANRSASGSSRGAMRGVVFGTGSGRERKHEYLREFFSAVDRALSPLLESERAPLVLAGVAYEAEIYRKISGYENIVPGAVAGNPGLPAREEIALRARRLVATWAEAQHQKMVSAFVNHTGAGRVLTNVTKVLRAASEGRVSELLVARGAKVVGHFEEAAGRSPGAIHAGVEDLLNAAAVETIRHGGRVWTLPSDAMPGGSSVAALLRY